MSEAPYEPHAETEPEPQPEPQRSSSGRGCLYGCLFMIFGSIGLVVCAGVAGYWWFTNQVEKYTSSTPADLPSVVYEGEQLAELKKRVDAFSEAMDKGETPPEDLVLTAEEINALISADDDMKGKVFVRIEDGEVSGDVSFPTDAFPGGKGRYFNGSASFEVSMNGGILIVTLTDAEVNDERLPQEFIDAMARENLAKGVYDNPDTAKALRQFESVAVEGDKIILKVKRDKPDNPEEATEATESNETAESDDAETPAAT